MIILAIGLLGVILGSFVNAFVWRLHETEKVQSELADSGKHGAKKAAKLRARLKALSITRGRSMCPHCGHELAAKDLVPILSWLYLGGRCRYCKANIPDSPFVELATGALFALSYVGWTVPLEDLGLFRFVIWLFFVVAFVALAVYDLRWFLLPDRIVMPLIAVALMQTLVVAAVEHSWTALWEPLAGAALIFGLFYGLYQVSKGGWIGGGDVKLVAALGLLAASPVRALLVIFFASMLGTLASLPILAKGKKGLKVHIPFGPYLLLATCIVVLYGQQVVDWYMRLFMSTY